VRHFFGSFADEVAHYAGLQDRSYGVGLALARSGSCGACRRRRLGAFAVAPRPRRLLPLQVQDEVARSEEERVAGTAREKLNGDATCPWFGSKLKGTLRSFDSGRCLLSRPAAKARGQPRPKKIETIVSAVIARSARVRGATEDRWLVIIVVPVCPQGGLPAGWTAGKRSAGCKA